MSHPEIHRNDPLGVLETLWKSAFSASINFAAPLPQIRRPNTVFNESFSSLVRLRVFSIPNWNWLVLNAYSGY